MASSSRRYLYRKTVDRIVRIACVGMLTIAVVPLGLVLYYVTSKGIGGINLDFLTHLPMPVGENGGGMANAIVGTLRLLGLAALFGIPPGILVGVYLSEYAHHRFGTWVRFSADVMSGVPSITVGLFVYSLVVFGRSTSRQLPARWRSRS